MKKVTIVLSSLVLLAAYAPMGAMAARGSASGKALARITFYSSDRGSGGPIASTGVRLQDGLHAAVDPSIIPYGSIVSIPGLGTRKAVDCGSAVTARTAARRSAGGNRLKANAIVIDVFVAKQSTLRRMAATFPMFVDVTWTSHRGGKSSTKLKGNNTSTKRTVASRPSGSSSTSRSVAQAKSERKTPPSLSSRG